jgi:double-stranded uracil-DNA glycosylase
MTAMTSAEAGGQGRPGPGWPRSARPGPADLAAARDLTIPDVIAPGLRVLFSGINPGLYSAATGWHFARPGNRFWPALQQSGFTPRQLHPSEQAELLGLGLGITNVAARATARADELTPQEIRDGGQLLLARAQEFAPEWLAILGVIAFRTAFSRKDATAGPQEAGLGGTRIWVLPNPSGLNAHWSAAALAAEFGRLREAAGPPP